MNLNSILEKVNLNSDSFITLTAKEYAELLKLNFIDYGVIEYHVICDDSISRKHGPPMIFGKEILIDDNEPIGRNHTDQNKFSDYLTKMTSGSHDRYCDYCTGLIKSDGCPCGARR